MIYTEVDTWPASFSDRVSMLRLMWKVSAEPDITLTQRHKLRRMALREFAKRDAYASAYLVNHRD